MDPGKREPNDGLRHHLWCIRSIMPHWSVRVWHWPSPGQDGRKRPNGPKLNTKTTIPSDSAAPVRNRTKTACRLRPRQADAMQIDLQTLWYLTVGTLLVSAALVLWVAAGPSARAGVLGRLAAGLFAFVLGCLVAMNRGRFPVAVGMGATNLLMMSGYSSCPQRRGGPRRPAACPGRRSAPCASSPSPGRSPARPFRSPSGTTSRPCPSRWPAP